MKIMNHDHPRWKEFYERLEGPEGCDFKEEVGGKIIHTCNGNKSFAIKILEAMGDIDIESSLKFFESRGGHCDCEILFNVA